MSALSNAMPAWIKIVFEQGGLGVAIFFVLSGFVMANSLKSATVNLDYFKRFAARRFLRLSPPYYVAIVSTLLFALLSTVVKKQPFLLMNEPVTIERLLAHLGYLQGVLGFANIDDVYWTLCIEVQFYLVFCVLVGFVQWLSRRHNAPLARELVFVPLAVLALAFPAGIIPDTGRSVLFGTFWYSFSIGVFAFWCWRQQFSVVLFYGYAIALIAIAIVNQSPYVFVVAITAILLLEAGRAARMEHWLKARPFQFLGKISYSLYLTHTPVIGIPFFIGQKLLPASALTDFICLSAALVAAIAYATGIWYLVERPAIAWSQRVKPINQPLPTVSVKSQTSV